MENNSGEVRHIDLTLDEKQLAMLKSKKILDLSCGDFEITIKFAEEKITSNTTLIGEMFEKLWKFYPRKEAKEQAKKTFEHKMRGLADEEMRRKGNSIYLLIMKKKNQWEENETEMQYIPMFSSLLNSEVPDSPKFKGNKKVK